MPEILQPTPDHFNERSKSKKHKKFVRLSAYIISAILIYSLGLGVGKGNIKFGASSSKTSDSSSSGASSATGLPENLNYDSVERVYDALRVSYDGKLDSTALLEGMKEGMVRAVGDPYTEYFTLKKEQQFEDDLNGTFSGIGAELSRDGELVIIQSPISGAPAEKAGLKARDAIVEIDGKTSVNITTEDAVKLIRGKEGTDVKLVVVRGGTQRLEFTITRSQIVIPSVESKILDGNIGYLKISRFAKDTAGLATKVADDFKTKNVKSIVLDMRNDPGGYLDAAVDVVGLWLPKDQTIVDERRDEQVRKTYRSTGSGKLGGIPTVVLLNGGSASASEITAGALHDSAGAVLVGEKSFGKGVVQEIKPLGTGSFFGNSASEPNEGSLKVTVARWFTPKGNNINKEGLQPDIKVAISDDEAKAGKDPQLDRALQKLKTGQ